MKLSCELQDWDSLSKSNFRVDIEHAEVRDFMSLFSTENNIRAIVSLIVMQIFRVDKYKKVSE